MPGNHFSPIDDHMKVLAAHFRVHRHALRFSLAPEESLMKRTLSPLLMCLLVATAAFAHEGPHDAADHDRMFADSMSKHHEDGIKMARMAVDKAESAELRSMAQKMIDDQSREITEMQSLRGDGPRTTMEEMQKMPGMMPESQMQRDMARLEAAQGREFDLAFTEIIAKHHQSAITMARDHRPKLKNAGLKEIASNIIEKQTEERKRLLAMHAAMEDGQPMTSSSSDRQRMAKD